MRGTGRFNVAQGAIATAQGLGAALSVGLSGFIVVGAGYSPAFLTLAGVAVLGIAVFLFAMPETAQPSPSSGLEGAHSPVLAPARSVLAP